MEVTIKLVKMDIFVIDKGGTDGLPANISKKDYEQYLKYLKVTSLMQKKLKRVYGNGS